MERFLALGTGTRLLGAAGCLGVLLLASPSLVAADKAPAPTNTAPIKPAAPAAPTPAPAPVAANKPPMPTPPPIPQEDPFNRYGKILAPGTEPAHPLKLALPLADVGEIKIATQDELTMREKLEQLASLSDDDIRKKLNQWPPFTKMSLKDQGMMLVRIQDFRERRARIAMDKAHEMGLLTLDKSQQAQFEKDYWGKRIPMERDLVKQIEPIIRAREQKMEEDLFRKYSSLAPIAQTPAPAAPPKPGDKPAPVPASNKPAPPATQAKQDNKPAPSQTANAADQMNPAPMR